MGNEKCSVRDGKFVEPCEHLRKACNGRSYGTAKGIFIHDLSYTDKERLGEPSRTFFSVKSGEYAKKGVALNFCPFCGVQIDSPFIEKPNPPINKWIDWHYTKENPFPKLDGDPLIFVKAANGGDTTKRPPRRFSYWRGSPKKEGTTSFNSFEWEDENNPCDDEIIAYMLVDPNDHD